MGDGMGIETNSFPSAAARQRSRATVARKRVGAGTAGELFDVEGATLIAVNVTTTADFSTGLKTRRPVRLRNSL